MQEATQFLNPISNHSMSFEKVFGVVVFSAIGFAFYAHSKKRPSLLPDVCNLSDVLFLFS